MRRGKTRTLDGKEMSLTRLSLWAMGIGGTVVYVGAGLAALTLDFQPRWFFVPVAVVCFVLVPLTWNHLGRALRSFENGNETSSADFDFSAARLMAHHNRDVRTPMRTSNVEGETVFRSLRRTQFGQRTFHTAFLLGYLFLVGWLWLLVLHPDHPNWAFVVTLGPLAACILVAAGALAYLITRRCPNCQTAFSWNWMRSDVLKRDENAGRCANCGIRINVSNL
jgi:hypothetical protein